MSQVNETVLIDYIRWRGDLGFDLVPFNEIDNVILAEISYLDCTQVLDRMSSTGPTLKEAFETIEEKDCYNFQNAVGGAKDFIEAAAESHRFGDLRLAYYSDVFDAERSIQFAAMHFQLTEITSYIAFRGTDNSITGWREDFMASFTEMPAQQMAVTYLHETMEKNRDYYVGGHSKGGNLAVYAVSQLTEKELRHILHVYDNDGPGFSADIYNLAAIQATDHLVTKIVPAYDVIGQLFFRDHMDYRIVSSTANGLLQHDPLTWCCGATGFSEAKQLDPAVKIINKTFHEWIENSNALQREAFVTDLFNSFEKNGAKHIDEIKLQDIPDIVRSMIDSSPATKELFKDLPKYYFSNAGKAATEFIEQIAEDTMSQITNVSRKGKVKK